MAKVRMLRTQPGSPNGIAIVNFEKGHVYTTEEMGADLVSVFLSIRAAEMVEEEAPQVEQKAIPSAPENQAIKEAPLNKSVATEEKKKEESKPSSTFKRRRGGGLERSK